MTKDSLSYVWLIPAVIALAVSILSRFIKLKPIPGATVYGYAQGAGLLMMIVSSVMMTVVLWPGAGFDPSSATGMRSFFWVFLLIGLCLSFFRIQVNESGIVQGFWPLKNVVAFGDVQEVERCERVRDSYLMLTLRTGKKYKFAPTQHYDDFCSQVIDASKQHGARVLYSHYKLGRKIYTDRYIDRI